MKKQALKGIHYLERITTETPDLQRTMIEPRVKQH